MGLSAAQVAAGYPPRRSGNFLMDTKKYPTVRGRVFQVYEIGISSVAL
jgi:hypothetical protein